MGGLGVAAGRGVRWRTRAGRTWRCRRDCGEVVRIRSHNRSRPPAERGGALAHDPGERDLLARTTSALEISGRWIGEDAQLGLLVAHRENEPPAVHGDRVDRALERHQRTLQLLPIPVAWPRSAWGRVCCPEFEPLELADLELSIRRASAPTTPIDRPTSTPSTGAERRTKIPPDESAIANKVVGADKTWRHRDHAGQMNERSDDLGPSGRHGLEIDAGAVGGRQGSVGPAWLGEGSSVGRPSVRPWVRQ